MSTTHFLCFSFRSNVKTVQLVSKLVSNCLEISRSRQRNFSRKVSFRSILALTILQLFDSIRTGTCAYMIMKSVRYARKRKARQTALVPRHKWAEGHHRFGNGSTKPRSIHARVTLIYFSAHDRALDHEPRCATAKPFVSSSS